MPIVSPYAAVLALLFVGLSIRTLVLRQRLRIAVGDAGNEVMLRAMRVHSNFAGNGGAQPRAGESPGLPK